MEQPQITLQELIAYIKENCIHGSLSESVHSEIEEKVKKPPFEILFGVHCKNVEAIEMITHIPDCNNDISMFASLLHCLHEGYGYENVAFTQTLKANSTFIGKMDDADKSIAISKFFAKWRSEVRKRFNLAKYTTPLHVWEKKELLNDLDNYNITPKIIAFIATYMNVNIFVINDQQIDLYCTNKTINKFKENLLIMHDNDTYRPLEYNKSTEWLFDVNPAFEHFITSQIAKIRIYQSNQDAQKIDVKIAYDSDIHIIWSALEGEIKALREQQAKYKNATGNSMHEQKTSDAPVSKVKQPVPQDDDRPDTTEQVMQEVMSKDIDVKDNRSGKHRIETDDEISSSEKSIDSNSKSPKKDTVYTKSELSAMTCKELKVIAKKRNIKTSTKIDGVSKPLNKKELIDKLV